MPRLSKDTEEVICACDPLPLVVSVTYARKKYYIFFVHDGGGDFHCTEVQGCHMEFLDHQNYSHLEVSCYLCARGTINIEL